MKRVKRTDDRDWGVSASERLALFGRPSFGERLIALFVHALSGLAVGFAAAATAWLRSLKKSEPTHEPSADPSPPRIFRRRRWPMRNRPSPERQRDPEHSQENARERNGQDAPTQNVRVPKIQFRFLKVLEERGASPRDLDAALDMSKKIRRYPLGPGAVMASWQQYTREAIAAYKEGRGDQASRERKHVAYAMVFQAVRSGPQVKDVAELEKRLHDVATQKNGVQQGNEQKNVEQKSGVQQGNEQKNVEQIFELDTEELPPRGDKDRATEAAPVAERAERAAPAAAEATRHGATQATQATRETHRMNEARAPAQRALPLSSRDRGEPFRPHTIVRKRKPSPELQGEPSPSQAQTRAQTQAQTQTQTQTHEPERGGLEVKAERLMEKLRGLPLDLRDKIELAARDMLLDGVYTKESAAQALPDAVAELRSQKTIESTVQALTLATIAYAPAYPTLVKEFHELPLADQTMIADEARARLERYPALDSGVRLLKGDQLGAAVHDVLAKTTESRKEALVLARVREEMEAATNPLHAPWQRYVHEMASDAASA